jgi:urease accessory protein UreE
MSSLGNYQVGLTGEAKYVEQRKKPREKFIGFFCHALANRHVPVAPFL